MRDGAAEDEDREEGRKEANVFFVVNRRVGGAHIYMVRIRRGEGGGGR